MFSPDSSRSCDVVMVHKLVTLTTLRFHHVWLNSCLNQNSIEENELQLWSVLTLVSPG
jgi:hypothetical protein